METKYNKWTLIKVIGPHLKRKYEVMWEVQCDCGYIGERCANNIINGNSKQCKSCGMKDTIAHRVYKDRPKRELVSLGYKFGGWTVIAKSFFKDGFWECKCECGKIKVHPEKYIRSELSIKCQQCETKRRRLIIIERRRNPFAKKSDESKEESTEEANNKISPINNTHRRYL